MATKPLFKEKSQIILRFLQAHPNEDYTADDIAEGTGLPTKSVNGAATVLSRQGYVQRIVVEGIEKKVITLTDEGYDVDPGATIEVPED
jgi:DNA-binding MarR family transcriptional regulator